MLTIHKTVAGKMTKLEKAEPGCWVNLTYPTEDELSSVITSLGIDSGFCGRP